jgi:RNA exonuclease 4
MDSIEVGIASSSNMDIGDRMVTMVEEKVRPRIFVRVLCCDVANMYISLTDDSLPIICHYDPPANNSGSIQNGDKPVCAFFVRGMCNRGTACAFKHDPSIIAPAPPSSRGYQGNNQMMLRNGTPNQQTIVPATPSFHRLGSGGSGRVFDPLKARAIQLAKDAQDKEDRSIFASPTHPELAKDATSTVVVAAEPPFFSIDVECIATGYGSCAKGINDGCGNEGKNAEGVPPSQYNELSQRYPGRVAVVDSEGNLLADVVIRPPKDGIGVVSYLTPLTGLTKEKCLGPEAKSLEEAVSLVKSLLPKDGVLVGQAIDHDVEWLGLTPGKDFERMVDLSVIFRQRVPAVLGKASDVLRNAAETGAAIGNKDAHPSSDESLGFDTRYRSFSLRHVCLNLLGTDIQSGVHDPIVDARYSLILFHKYRNASVTQLRIVRDGLHRAPVTPGFAAEKTPVLDGVCVSAAGFPYKRAARKIWRWYSGKKGQQTNSCS